MPNNIEPISKDLYFALINQEEQYSLWPDYKAIPNGWNAKFGPASKEECLAYVEKMWTDMRPLSLRTQMAQITK
jgi:MbtH protein